MYGTDQCLVILKNYPVHDATWIPTSDVNNVFTEYAYIVSHWHYKLCHACTYIGTYYTSPVVADRTVGHNIKSIYR